MGITWSGNLNDVESNPYILRLIGHISIDLDAQFWSELFTFHYVTPSLSHQDKELEECFHTINIIFARNNLTTGNFGTMIRFFVKHIQQWSKMNNYADNHNALIAYNCLFSIRCICKHYFEVLRENIALRQFLSSSRSPQIKSSKQDTEDASVTKQVIESENKETVEEPEDKDESKDSEIRTRKDEQVESQENIKDKEDKQEAENSCIISEDELLSTFVKELMNFIASVPVVKNTYHIHYEAINTMIVLLSAELYSPKSSDGSPFYKAVMDQESISQGFIRALLDNFTHQLAAPNKHNLYVNSGLLYTIGSAVASGLWAMLSRTKVDPQDNRKSPLGTQSLLLLLILVNHCTRNEEVRNPFRGALFKLGDNRGDSEDDQKDNKFPYNLSALYATVCRELQTDEATLLLYLLLHRNSMVSSYILSRNDIDVLILPILKLLYEAEEKNSHHIYMALIILLILSQDDVFNNSIHFVVLPSVPWFTERSLNQITLGGLLVLIVIRTIQFNMTKMRDKYLHTNCLAALANMSAYFRSLHPYVAQRLLSLYALISKKHAKVSEQIRYLTSQQKPINTLSEVTEPCHEEPQESEDYAADLAILEEVIRMILEIINSCLTHSLKYNPHLIYAMLHQKELFTQFRTHPIFQDIIQNIETVLGYFNSRLEETGEPNLSVDIVLKVINEGAELWKTDRLKKFPDLRFKYVEEDQPEEFFIPYVWSLVCNSSNLYFNVERIKLF